MKLFCIYIICVVVFVTICLVSRHCNNRYYKEMDALEEELRKLNLERVEHQEDGDETICLIHPIFIMIGALFAPLSLVILAFAGAISLLHKNDDHSCRRVE